MNHMQSLRFEHKLYAQVKQKMEEMQQHNMSWIEVQFLKKAVDVLCQCRATLMYTYVFAFYLKKNNQSIIFEVGENMVIRNSDNKDEWNRVKTEKFGEIAVSICTEVVWIFCLQYGSHARHRVGALLAEEAELQVAILWNKKKDEGSGFEPAKNAWKLKAGVLPFPGALSKGATIKIALEDLNDLLCRWNCISYSIWNNPLLVHNLSRRLLCCAQNYWAAVHAVLWCCSACTWSQQRLCQ